MFGLHHEEMEILLKPFLIATLATPTLPATCQPVADGVTLDYLNHQGKPVRIRFAFDTAGKISQIRREPALR